jgi:hypothetical protein
MIEKAQGTYSSGTVQDLHLIPYYGIAGKPASAPLPDKDISISFAIIYFFSHFSNVNIFSCLFRMNFSFQLMFNV